ncbi:MAG: hypothetical protein L0H15_07055 [Nitrosospira sp.]|nr:hypothetical protein [Nitrosospira sp.]MDN5935293.1 hypothetical protein [Nitrosospira sp.]
MVNRSRHKKTGDIPGWSWIFAAVGLVLTIGSAGFMLYQGFAGDSPPELVIETDGVVPNGRGYLVQIRVTNRGGSVAAGLVVEAMLREGTATVETSTITMGYVPSGSQRRAGFFFSRDPRKFDLQILAKGYVQP